MSVIANISSLKKFSFQKDPTWKIEDTLFDALCVTYVTSGHHSRCTFLDFSTISLRERKKAFLGLPIHKPPFPPSLQKKWYLVGSKFSKYPSSILTLTFGLAWWFSIIKMFAQLLHCLKKVSFCFVDVVAKLEKSNRCWRSRFWILNRNATNQFWSTEPSMYDQTYTHFPLSKKRTLYMQQKCKKDG